jgi:hypothetical protein
MQLFLFQVFFFLSSWTKRPKYRAVFIYLSKFLSSRGYKAEQSRELPFYETRGSFDR